MKKTERQAKQNDQKELQEDCKSREKAIEAFVDECKSCMPTAATQVKIKPKLRTAIEVVLETRPPV
jgi:hypothetical protein